VQDVAIDALAVNVLRDEERGQGNGLMFAGAYIGQIVGGAGVQFLLPYLPSLNPAFVVVALAILTITASVSLRLREPPAPRPTGADGGTTRSALGAVGAEIRAYVVTAMRSMLASRANVALAVMALFPAGAYALSLTLKQPLGVELGFRDTKMATFNLVTTLFAAAGCAAGGWLSDKLGRRKALALYIVLMSLPNLLLAWSLHRHGWIFPVNPTAATKPVAADALVTAFWASAVASALFMGLMYGARSALYMDLSNPAVAGTQFTAYMSLMNLALSYSAWWQGKAAVKLGYPATLLIDAGFGLVCLLVLPLTLARAPNDRPVQAGAQEKTAPRGAAS
jgi:MFS transporter, PAT family, beta-lactamase induction signal transducer AmpG